MSISNLFTGDAPTAVLTFSRRARGGEIAQRAVAQFVMHPAGLTRALSRIGLRAGPRPVPGQAGDPPRRPAAVRAQLGDRGAARGHQRRAARPQHDPGRPAHAARHPLDLRGLRRLRRGRAPRRRTASRERWRRWRPSTTSCTSWSMVADGGAAALPVRDPVRPRAVPGRDVPGPVRRGPGRAWSPGWPRPTSPPRTTSIEGWGRTQALVGELADADGARADAACRARPTAMDKSAHNQPDAVTADRATPARPGAEPASGDETFHVFGSGNLGLIYVRGEKERLDRRELCTRGSPGWCDGLADHPGVGFVVVTDDDGPVALGAQRLAPARRRPRRGRGPAAAVRSGRARASSTGSRTGPRRRTSTSTAWSTPAPRRSPPSRAWSAATAGSAAGRTGPACSRPSTYRSRRSGSSGPTRCTARWSRSCATTVTVRTSSSQRRQSRMNSSTTTAMIRARTAIVRVFIADRCPKLPPD